MSSLVLDEAHHVAANHNPSPDDSGFGVMTTRPDPPRVFLNEQGVRLRGRRDWFESALKESRVQNYCSWHCKRHTFTSRLVMAGVDPTPSMTWR